jgi:hypothetical protein
MLKKQSKKQQEETVGCSLCGSLDDFDNIIPCEGCHRLYHLGCAGLEVFLYVILLALVLSPYLCYCFGSPVYYLLLIYIFTSFTPKNLCYFILFYL